MSTGTRAGVGRALVLVALASALYAPLALRDGLPSAPHSDANFATKNARGFIAGLTEGEWLPRWHAEVNRGYGAPTFLFYSPFAYYAVAGVEAVTGDLLGALRATTVLLAAASGLAFLLVARRRVPLVAAAAGAALYVALPYHAIDAYERLALGECAAFVWLPLVFGATDRLCQGPSQRAWLALAASYAALVMTHLVSAFLTAFVLVPFAALRLARGGRWTRALPLGGAIATGLLCSAVFLLPVFLERSGVQVDYANTERFDWRRSVLFLDEAARGYATATIKPLVERSAIAQGALALGALATFVLHRRRRAQERPSDATGDAAFAWAATAVWTFALQTALTWPLWAFVPELGTAQFPWRFGLFQALAAAMLASFAVAAGIGERTGGAPSRAWLPLAATAALALALSLHVALAAEQRFDDALAAAPAKRTRPTLWLIPSGVPDRNALAAEPPILRPLARLGAPGSIEYGRWTPHHRALRYRSERDAPLRVHTFWFPGWRARIDGEPTPVAAGGRWGALELAAPAGAHHVELTFDATPVRTLGARLSVLGLVVLGIVAVAGRGGASRSSAGAVGRAVASSLCLTTLVGCGAPERPTPRHLVVLTLDTVRRDHLTVYGYDRPTTPRLEAFARESVVFDHAFAQDTNTNPSHASMFTGRYPHAHGSRANGQVLAAGIPTLALLLREQGFATGGFVSSAVLGAAGSGLDRGFDVYDDDFSARRRTGQRTVERAIAWRRAQPADQRTFLFVHLYDAHGPYRAPEAHLETFRSPEPHGTLPLVPRHMRAVDGEGRPFRHLSQFVDRYDAALRHVDDLFGLLMQGIALEDTAVVVLADHGETLGERYHGLDHGGQVFDEQIRIPLIVHVPGVAPGRVDALVETVDLLPTAFDLLGLAPPPQVARTIQGRSWLALLTGASRSPEPLRERVHAAARAVSARHADRGYALDRSRRIQTVRSQRWKLIRYPGLAHDHYELYDLEADPAERADVADAHPEVVDALRARLVAWSADDDAGETRLEPELERQLRALGYVDEPSAAGPDGAGTDTR